MPSVKLRKVGSSNVLTVPKEFAPQYQNYDAFMGHDGAIIFLPKTKNPFTDKEFIEQNTGALTDSDFTETEVLDEEFK